MRKLTQKLKETVLLNFYTKTDRYIRIQRIEDIFLEL